MKRKMKRCIAVALCLIMGIHTSAAAIVPEKSVMEVRETNISENEGGLLRIWYDEPAPISSSNARWWQSTVLPLGNGNIGGMVFGGISKDRIHINEKTLWSGGPRNGTDLSNDGNPYQGGNRLTYAGDDKLEEYRQQLDNKSTNVFGLPFNQSNNILTSNFFSGRQNKGSYMDFGDIELDFSGSGINENAVSHYSRDLNMETAVSTVRYDYEGDTYTREIFVSYPDNVLVCRLSSTGNGKLTFNASLSGAMAGSKNISVSGNKITLKGSLNDNGMKYEAQMAVLNEGGSIQAGTDKISVSQADEVTLILSAGTDYKNEYPTYRGDDPSQKVTDTVDSAVEKGYQELLETHLNDYQELFSRVSLDLGTEVPQIPTDELVINYRNGEIDQALEVMIYQYGRYLTIAGSREGTLPTNLCGIWLLGGAGELWGGDYHYNVNLQMNYWPTYNTNLAECGVPLNEFAKSLVVPGRYAAYMGFGATVDETAPIGEGNGFLVHTAGNPFGATAPAGVQEYGWNPNGGTWLLQNVYDYYRFTQDKQVLADTIYPMLKEAANFWAKHLWYSKNQNRLTVTPSVSAEQGPTAVGTTYDQSLVWQLFEESIQAAEILDVDAADVAVWKEKQTELKPIMISDAGYIKEWYEETTPGRAKDGNLAETTIPNFNAGYTYEIHRHSSHLIGLYPGSLINKDNEEYIQAARKSLIQRDFAGTGWSKAHRINLWARALDGNNAYRLVQGMLQGGNAGILTNLLDSHGNGNGNHTDYPVFQIDGNYGITAGMTEMLLQSHLGYTQFLPALPDAWSNGSVSGLVARGNFVVDMKWEDKEATHVQVLSRSGGTFIAEYPDLGSASVQTLGGTSVKTTKLSEDKISFETEKGQSYVFKLGKGAATLSKTVDEAKALAETMNGVLLSSSKAELLEAVKTAEQLLAKGADDYTAALEAMTSAYEAAKAAVQLAPTYREAEILYNNTPVGDKKWNFSEEEYAEFGQAFKDAKELLRSTATQQAYQDADEKLQELIQQINERTSALIPTFSVAEGKVDANTTVEIISPDPALQIRYTLDGSEPNGYSKTYEGPFLVKKGETLHLRAALFLNRSRKGMIADADYYNNLSMDAVGSSQSSAWNDKFVAEVARDGKKAPDKSSLGMDSRWAPRDNEAQNWMVFEFSSPVTVNSTIIEQYKTASKNHIDGFKILYSDDNSNWKEAYSSSDAELEWTLYYKGSGYDSYETEVSFPEVTAKYFKFEVTAGANPSVWEWELYHRSMPQATDKDALLAAIQEAQDAYDKELDSTLTEQQKKTLKDAFVAANEVFHDGFSSQSDVDKAAQSLSEILLS